MTQAFATPTNRKSFDGTVLLSVDGGTTVWAFPMSTISVGDTDNVYRGDVIDGQGYTHIEQPGVRMGSLDFACPLMPDRGVNTFITAACGIRTSGQLTPMIANIIPNNGASTQKMTGIWIRSIGISGRFGVPGQQSQIGLRVSCLVMDIDNFFGAATLSAPTTFGKNGAGAASFALTSFTDGASSPATYDSIRSFSWSVDNQLTVDPAMSVPASRIAGGCVPGPVRGAITLEQLSNPTNPLPAVRGIYGLAITIPTGDSTHSMLITSSMSRDGSSLNLVPTDFIGRGQLYAMFGISGTPATTSGAWPFVTSYS